MKNNSRLAHDQDKKLSLGALLDGRGGCSFRVWAPLCKTVTLKILSRQGVRLFEMPKNDQGYFSLHVPGITSGMKYVYILDNDRERPDPVSRFLPHGLHGATEIGEPQGFSWRDRSFQGIDPSELIFYEMHVGAFTPQGTFESAIARIPYLKKLGITCLEIMPVAQFPGKRNWGYDGASLFAVQDNYGGPEGMKKLVNACHRQGIAVCLDVVYNHFGPEGNYLREFGPYFTNRYQVPWGEAVNFDGPDSDQVRHFFIENARYWIREFHVDGLRLDAVHAIYDFSARHILKEIRCAVEEEGRARGVRTFVIAESDLNDSRLIRAPHEGGYALCGQWSDDFHHAVHAFLTGERSGYYQDFGALADIAAAMEKGFVYDGRYSSHRRRHHGNKVSDLPPEKLVVAIQNHDQVGNRAFGERLAALLPFEAQKLAATLLLLSPQTPFLFMGEEFGETRPFQYFVDHDDPELVRLVREGRRKEFASFGWDDIPDPKALSTFRASCLDWRKIFRKQHRQILALYHDLIKVRKEFFSDGRRIIKTRVSSGNDPWMMVEYSVANKQRFIALFSFSPRGASIGLPFRPARFRVLFNSFDPRYGGLKIKPLLLSPGEVQLPSAGAIFGIL